MRHRAAWAAALLLAACTAFGQEPAAKSSAQSKKSAPPAEQMDVKALLESNVRAAWAAFKAKNKQAYGEFLTEDFTAVEADSYGARNKWHVLREVEQSVVYDFTLGAFRVTQLGPDAAYVTYECTMQFPPKATIKYERVYIIEVWVKRNREWKTLHYQETRVK
jgi:ketosteroid isomerase-like protein